MPTPEIVEYSTDTSTGATSQSGTVPTGAGLQFLSFTRNSRFGYGLDTSGNLWGYSVQSANGMLTSLGVLALGLSATSNLQIYDSSVVWVISSNASTGLLAVNQYPINVGGTLGSPTTVSLSGQALIPFTPAGSTVPSAVWTFSTFSNQTATLNVYPVNTDGTISATSIQTLTAPPLATATTGAFAYGIGGLPPNTQTLYTFSLTSNGTLTPVSAVSLTTMSLWEITGQLVPGIGSTLDLFNASGSLNVYPVSSTGSIGSLLGSASIAASPQFPFALTVDPSTGPSALSQLPTIWVHASGSTSIDEYPINGDGTIGALSGNLPTGGNVVLLEPGQSPIAYGVDQISGASGTIYGYGVSSSGSLTALGSFAGPTIPGGGSELAFPFKPLSFSSTPVALFVYTINPFTTGGLTITVYPLGANELPSGSPLTTISSSALSVESYVVLQNGELLPFAFGGF